MTVQAALATITSRVIERSKQSREQFLAQMQASSQQAPRRARLSCGNQAHGFAACDAHDKAVLKAAQQPNLAIVTAYNDMLSAHQPYGRYPELIKQAARAAGATAQVAGGVPAMCDGVTQGQGGMELSLFSRDVIAMSTAIALSHDMFDAVLCLGICDKIVPGLLIGALQFAQMPVAFVPSGPMPSGLANKEKIRIREQYAKGEAGRDALLEAEAASYHAPGTCTFYGTANSNQMLMEMMGLQLPGSSFVPPDTPLRDAVTRQTVHTVLGAPPLWQLLDEKTLINAVVGLCSTGGSTNHTLHLVAIARAAGISINWQDMADISAITPLLCRIYPNGEADVNDFHAAGGVPQVMKQLLAAGLLHEDVTTIMGQGLSAYTQLPRLDGEAVVWDAVPETSPQPQVVASIDTPFAAEGGMVLLQGNLGRAVMKTSSLKPEQWAVEAPVRVFTSQQALQAAFAAGELHKDVVVVVIGQGPKANGMPELHALMPPLGVLQGLGYRVALVTDGRLSGASGKVPAAIHVSPEAIDGGPLAKLRDGDVVRLDAAAGVLEATVPPGEWQQRTAQTITMDETFTLGRGLFAHARQVVCSAERGASFLWGEDNVD